MFWEWTSKSEYYSLTLTLRFWQKFHQSMSNFSLVYFVSNRNTRQNWKLYSEDGCSIKKLALTVELLLCYYYLVYSSTNVGMGMFSTFIHWIVFVISWGAKLQRISCPKCSIATNWMNFDIHWVFSSFKHSMDLFFCAEQDDGVEKSIFWIFLSQKCR